MAQWCKESACQCRRQGFDPWDEKNCLKEEMATHSSILAWEIPQTEPGGLSSMGSLRVRDNLATEQALKTIQRKNSMHE